jgi:preprotein translocase subunit SecA
VSAFNKWKIKKDKLYDTTMYFCKQIQSGQKNPTQEYKRESFAMFETLLNTINVEIVKALSSVSINENTSADDVEQQNNDDISAIHSNPLGRKTQHEAAVMENTVSEKPSDSQTYQRSGEKIGRNDPCPCSSGKKYKRIEYLPP